MTRLEKAKELHPGYSEEAIIQNYCPEDLIDMEMPNGIGGCVTCWNKEYTEVTPCQD